MSVLSIVLAEASGPTMINKINNTTNKANPPAKPQPPQLPPKPITVPPLNRRRKTKVHSCVLTDSIYFMLLLINGAGPFQNRFILSRSSKEKQENPYYSLRANR